jgi:hypothetical protein
VPSEFSDPPLTLPVTLRGVRGSMTRGNQREVDRQRAAKRAEKNTGKTKKKDDDKSKAQALTNKKES